jgi:toxin FitB
VSYLLDTNVVSEWTKPRPDVGVIAWLADVDEDRVLISVITLAELRHGIDRLAQGSRRTRLNQWLSDELPLRFEGRIVPVDAAIADRWGQLMARSSEAGRPISAMDAFIAATAVVRTLDLVTRNVGDFKGWVKSVINPWSGG